MFNTKGMYCCENYGNSQDVSTKYELQFPEYIMADPEGKHFGSFELDFFSGCRVFCF